MLALRLAIATWPEEAQQNKKRLEQFEPGSAKKRNFPSSALERNFAEVRFVGEVAVMAEKK